jgi:hypothetical protein
MIDGANSVYRGVEGSGAAFLFPPTHADAIGIYGRVKANREKTQALKDASYHKDLNDLGTMKAWAQDVGDFQRYRGDYVSEVTQAHRNKYDQDGEFLKKKEAKKEFIGAQQARSAYHQKQYDAITKDMMMNPQNYDLDEAHKMMEDWKNTPLEKRPDNIFVPQLNPMSWSKSVLAKGNIIPHDIDQHPIKNNDGTITDLYWDRFNRKKSEEIAATKYNEDTPETKSGKSLAKKMAISDLAAKNIDFNVLPKEEQDKIVKEVFVRTYADLQESAFPPKKVQKLKSLPKGAEEKQRSLKELQTSGLVTPTEINTVASDGSGKPAVVKTAGTLEWPKGARGAGKVTIAKNSQHFDPTLNKFVKNTESGEMDFEPGQSIVIQMKDGTWAPYVSGVEITKDADGHVIRKPVSVPLDEVLNLAKKNNVQTKWAYDLAAEKNKKKPAEKTTVGKFKGVPKGGF